MDYMGTLKALVGIKYIYFTSGKSQLVELANWLNDNFGATIFSDALIYSRETRINYSHSFRDIMITNIYSCS